MESLSKLHPTIIYRRGQTGDACLIIQIHPYDSKFNYILNFPGVAIRDPCWLSLNVFHEDTECFCYLL